MNNQTKPCQNCKTDFLIDECDALYYEKINVPHPTWCPQCRIARRFSFVNTWSIYKRKCAKCEKSTMSIYAADKSTIVYCMSCWWGDTWDGSEYAMDYDPGRPFFEQLKELTLKTPWQTLTSLHTSNINSEYTNAVAYLKNCYLTFWADYCENVFYSSYLMTLKDSLDCYRMKDSELCYESVGCNKCYRTFFSEECDSCTDTWFSRACAGLVNCFGCINLRNKSYCIFNEQYDKESYFQKLKELNLESKKSLNDLKQKVSDFWLSHPNRSYVGNSLNVNVTGDYIYESKNALDSYMIAGVEDSRYVQFVSVPSAKDCYDYSGWGAGAELVYETAVTGGGSSNVKFSDECWPDALNVEYSMYANACKNVFGCINLKHKQYCILNKEYSKEEYEKLKEQIIEDMKTNPYIDELGRVWKYGEFLPIDLSPFGYNESNAHRFFPKTKEQALSEGYTWYEATETVHPITKKATDLPDTITSTDESVLNENIGCKDCGKAFKVVVNELGLMQKLQLPLPHSCPACRQTARFKRTNSPELYDRHCAKCSKDIKTSYSPDRPEVVYCEQCYQQEIS